MEKEDSKNEEKIITSQPFKALISCKMYRGTFV